MAHGTQTEAWCLSVVGGREQAARRIVSAGLALLALLAWWWGSSHPHVLVRLGDQLRTALGAPPAEQARLAAMIRGNDARERCLRRVLPRAFDPDLHGDRMAAAHACLARAAPASLFGPIEFGYDARNRLPLFVGPEPTPGCNQRDTGRVAISYHGLSETSCPCVGLPYYGVGETNGYSGCAAATSWQRFTAARTARSGLSFAPFGVGLSNLPSIVELSEAERYLPVPVRGFAGPLSFRVRALRVAQSDVQLPGRLEIRYRRISGAASQALFAEPALRELTVCKEYGAAIQESPRLLTWGAGSEQHAVELPARCEHVTARFEAALHALPEIDCAALPMLPRAGVGCLTEAQTAPFVALRRGLVELRALSDGLADALCVALARVLVGPKNQRAPLP